MFLTNVDLDGKEGAASKESQKTIESINLLYLAYYNCGVENDHMGYIEKAIKLVDIAFNMH